MSLWRDLAELLIAIDAHWGGKFFLLTLTLALFLSFKLFRVISVLSRIAACTSILSHTVVVNVHS